MQKYLFFYYLKNLNDSHSQEMYIYIYLNEKQYSNKSNYTFKKIFVVIYYRALASKS